MSVVEAALIDEPLLAGLGGASKVTARSLSLM